MQPSSLWAQPTPRRWAASRGHWWFRASAQRQGSSGWAATVWSPVRFPRLSLAVQSAEPHSKSNKAWGGHPTNHEPAEQSWALRSMRSEQWGAVPGQRGLCASRAL